MRYFVIGGIASLDNEKEKERFKNACILIGQTLGNLGHSLIICSPFRDSADYWVLNGFIKNIPTDYNVIELHFVDSKAVRTEIENLESSIEPHKIIKIPHPDISADKQDSLSYAWLFCQLQALESCQSIIAIGGKIDGAANMLLLLAEAKRKRILPLSFLGGAAGQAFYRRRYELEDRLGSKYILLQDEKSVVDVLKLGQEKHEDLLYNNSLKSSSLNIPNIFISYPRDRPAEADYIETLLRRRNIQVFRDESDFGAGCSIPTKITEAIYAANVFIAVWCAEYASSPWCFDELELALDRYKDEKIKLWIFRVDSTRIVPKRARDLNYYSVSTREEIEGRVLALLGK